jgi:membrane protein
VEQLLSSSLVKLAKPDETVQAVADYSVDYSKRVFLGVIAAARKWQADDAGGMAASVAYYLALSLFPMLLLLTAGLGLVFRFTSLGQDAEKQILLIVAEHCSPTLEQQVREVLAQIREHSLVGGPFGLLTAILAAIGVFYQFERAFDRIWRIKPKADKGWVAACLRIISQRLSAFFLLTAVGAGILMILLGNLTVGFVHAWMTKLQIPGTAAISAVDACTTLLFNAAVFGMLYRWLPKRRIQLMDALRGGLLAALIWEAGRQLLGAVLIGVKYTAAYGAIGSFIALLLWCYWGVSIILFGAEYAQVLSDQRRGHDDCSTDEELAPLEQRLLRQARKLAALPYPASLKKSA